MIRSARLQQFIQVVLIVFGMLAAGAFGQKSGTRAPLPNDIVLASMPSDAREVAAAVATAKPGEKITLRGRIAMAKDAFDSTKGIFILTDDAAVSQCCPRDGTVLETCKLGSEKKATIQLVDASGQPVAGGVEGRSGLRHGAEVFIIGNVSSTSRPNAVAVTATGVHIPSVALPLGVIVSEIENPADVSEVRKSGELKKGDPIVIRGLIGGSKEPFVGGRAMFTIVGSALKPCNARPDDKCEVPWDYCCDPMPVITANSATIRLVDKKGHPLKLDMKGRAGIRELSDVVVSGRFR